MRLNTSIKIILLVSSVILFTACGQRGPLYLPGNPPPGYYTGTQSADEQTNSWSSSVNW